MFYVPFILSTSHEHGAMATCEGAIAQVETPPYGYDEQNNRIDLKTKTETQ